MHTFARMLLIGLLTAASLVRSDVTRAECAPAAPSARLVYLAGGLSDEATLSLGAFAAARPHALLLFDSPAVRPYLKHFLAAYQPDRVIPVGTFREDAAGLSARLGVPVAPPVRWDSRSGVCPLWTTEGVAPNRIVVCPPRPRELLLRAAHLAALESAPLWILNDDAVGRRDLQAFLTTGPGHIVLVGRPKIDILGARLTRLESLAAVEEASLRRLEAGGAIRNAVVTNPTDATTAAGMSALAPWLAATRRAALLFTAAAGTDVAARVAASGRRPSLTGLDTLLLAGDLRAIPTQQRPNPIPGDKDVAIDMEPLTPEGDGPYSYAIGRLFHDDRAVVPLMLARQRLLAERPGTRKVLVASNPGGGLSLLETYSRNTVNELRNVGYEVTALFGRELTGEVLRKEMPGHEVILWEGHHNTLVKEWGFTSWEEPLAPTFVFLQSCLALQTEKVHPLLTRGALGVLGTSTRTYSGSGGAFSLAYFNALLYEGQTLGGSLRQAKNFLAAYALLKQKRLGKEATRLGANQRAAWAFTLWGDPTYRLPSPGAAPLLPAVRHSVEGNTIVVELPGSLHDRVRTDRYQVQVPPNARLAGLVRKTGDDAGQPLVPFVFAEVRLPGAPAGTPRLRSRLPSTHWAFLWDARRQTGYLLATPRSLDRGELRFRIDWPDSVIRAANKAGATDS